MKGLGAKPSVFEVQGAKKNREDAFKAEVAGAAGLRARYKAFTAGKGATDLVKGEFVALMQGCWATESRARPGFAEVVRSLGAL